MGVVTSSPSVLGIGTGMGVIIVVIGQVAIVGGWVSLLLLLSSGCDDDVCGGMVTVLSMQVVGSSLLSLGCDDAGSGMVAVSSMQVMVMVVVSAVAGSC